MYNYPSSQKEASTLAGRLSQIGTRYAWNLSKPDTRSRLAGGVCTPHHARRKGYSDFVQDTGPVMSGLLRVSFSDVQPLRVIFGYSQAAHNSYRVEQSLCRRNSRMQIGCNSLMRLNYNESLELAKRGGSPSVGHRVTRSKPVQPSGVSLVFLRCSALSLRPQASSTQAEKLALGFSGFSRSTLASISSINSCGNRMPLYEDLLFLCPVAIASAYVVMLVSDDNTGRLKTSEVFKHKMIDVFKHHEIRYLNTLSTGKAQEAHKIATPRSAGTLPRRLTTNVNHSNEAAMSNHTTPLAGRNSFTPNKFTWRFLAISRTDRNAKPCRMSVEAHTEREARQVLAPHFILSLAARLPVQGVSHA